MYRRDFLKFLAASPIAAAHPLLGGSPSLLDARDIPLISHPGEGLSVFDFEAVARKVVSPAHFGYLASGANDDDTLHVNRLAYNHYHLRPRRLVDVSNVSTKTQLLGMALESPILIQPVGGQRKFHAEGELATARAAGSRNTALALSTISSVSIEDVAAARGEPIIFQLYASEDWPRTQTLLRRAEAAGCQIMMWTVDMLGGRNLETFQRFRRLDSGDCNQCHDGDPAVERRRVRLPPAITWDYLDRLKEATTMKIMVKGIDTREDASICVARGADGIVVSNHGGRAADTGRGTLDALPEVVDAVAGRIPVVVDGGIRRGTDIFKALALGATAVGIGRPYVWGLGAFGQPGVEAVLDILREELLLVMRQCGTRSVAEITGERIMAARSVAPVG